MTFSGLLRACSLALILVSLNEVLRFSAIHAIESSVATNLAIRREAPRCNGTPYPAGSKLQRRDESRVNRWGSIPRRLTTSSATHG